MTAALKYYWQRLAPFLGVYIFFELVELFVLFGMGCTQPSDEDLLESILTFINENAACLAFTLLPYLLYLLVLPRDFHGGKCDRRFTLIIFSLFCLLNWLEEFVEIVSADSFRLLTRDFFMNPAQGWQEMLELPYCEWIASLLLIELIITVCILRKRLMPSTGVPGYMFRAILPAIVAGAGFLFAQQAQTMDIVAEVPTLYDAGLFHILLSIYNLDAVPDLAHIYASPCMILGAAVLFVTVSCALVRQNFPQLEFKRKNASTSDNLLPLLLIFLAGILLCRLLSLGVYPLMDTTEARYGEMARKMVETGNWLQPQFEYGVPFWGKPPLSFWGSASTMLLCGVNEFGARLAPYLATCGIGLCFLLWPFPERRWEQSAGCIIVLFSSAMGFVTAGAVMTDAFLAFGTTLSLITFYRAVNDEEPRRIWGYLFFLGLAIGLLSKGPLALVVCGIPIFVWTLWQKQWSRIWKRIPWFSGTALMLLLSVPWYIAAEQATPGFLRYFIIGEHIERFLVKGWAGDLYGKGHSRAIGTIWLYGLEMFLPWVLLVPFIIRKQVHSFSTASSRYLWCWALSTPVFFTVARNILPAYILPAVPAFCILLVRRLWALQAAEKRDYRQFLFAAFPVLLIVCLFASGQGFEHIRYRCQQKLLMQWDGVSSLYYVDNKVPYSAQFYSAGKALCLTGKADELAPGSYLAVHRAHVSTTITMPESWELIAEDGSWKLFRKR